MQNDQRHEWIKSKEDMPTWRGRWDLLSVSCRHVKEFFVCHHCVTIRFHVIAPLATEWKLEVLCGQCSQSKVSHPWNLSGFSFPATRLLVFSFFCSFVRFTSWQLLVVKENAKRLFIHALFLWDLMHVYTYHLKLTPWVG